MGILCLWALFKIQITSLPFTKITTSQLHYILKTSIFHYGNFLKHFKNIQVVNFTIKVVPFLTSSALPRGLCQPFPGLPIQLINDNEHFMHMRGVWQLNRQLIGQLISQIRSHDLRCVLDWEIVNIYILSGVFVCCHGAAGGMGQERFPGVCFLVRIYDELLPVKRQCFCLRIQWATN